MATIKYIVKKTLLCRPASAAAVIWLVSPVSQPRMDPWLVERQGWGQRAFIDTWSKRFRPMSSRIIEYPISGLTLTLELANNVFEPTTTTQILASQMGDVRGKNVLDLGCGAGPIAIVAAKSGAGKVHAVDVMGTACELTRRNARLNGVADRVDVRQGNLFESVRDESYDIIVCDVSGIADEVARISPWYPDPIPAGGPDGTEPTVGMLKESKSHLKDRGYLVFAVAGLARSEKIINAARELYGEKLQQVMSRMMPFCKEMYANLERLLALKEQGTINFIQQRTRYLWELIVYRAEK
jgi:precorrin-6B methylase 2